MNPTTSQQTTVEVKPLKIYCPLKAIEVLSAKARYRVMHGGRGSGKSYAFANYCIVKALGKTRILCTREMQNSIRDSVHRLLCDRIYAMGLSSCFTIGKDFIRSKTGSEFIFKGLHQNIQEIKSMEGIDICWVEEAERVTQNSWDVLIPTIRKEESEILISFNPESETSATYQKFVIGQPDNCITRQLLYSDNELFPEVLRKEMEYDKRVDYEKYEHVWLGKPKAYAHALIFKGKFRVEEFNTPEDVQFYFGADWGFSNDPSCLLRMFIRDRKLYIDYEAYGIGVELDDLPQFFASVPESDKWPILGDNARPETISHLCRHGYQVTAVEKGKGSVEDGIEFIRSFEEILIHPRCPHTYNDFNNYKWKTDRITNAVLPIPADGSDHAPDACRYGLENYILSKKSIFEIWGN